MLDASVLRGVGGFETDKWREVGCRDAEGEERYRSVCVWADNTSTGSKEKRRLE